MLRQPLLLCKGTFTPLLSSKLSFKVAANPPSPSGICRHGLLLTIKIRKGSRPIRSLLRGNQGLQMNVEEGPFLTCSSRAHATRRQSSATGLTGLPVGRRTICRCILAHDGVSQHAFGFVCDISDCDWVTVHVACTIWHGILAGPREGAPRSTRGRSLRMNAPKGSCTSDNT